MLRRATDELYVGHLLYSGGFTTEELLLLEELAMTVRLPCSASCKKRNVLTWMSLGRCCSCSKSAR